MRFLKYALIGIGGVIVVAGGVLAYVAATFDPNAYKPLIVQMVKEKKNRTLRLDGDIKLAIWPNLGADLGRLSLSEVNSDKEFLAVENARVSLKLIPLLSKQAVVDEVAIKGARAHLVRFKDGRMNIDDLLAKDDRKQEQVGFDIDHVVVENAALGYRDEATGARYAVSNLNLRTGRVVPGLPGSIELSVGVAGSQPEFNLNVVVRTRLTLDLANRVYALEDLGLEAKGQVARFTNVAAKASGSIVARLKAGELSTNKLAITVSGASGKDKIDLKLDAPRLSVTGDKAAGDRILAVATLTGPQRTFSAQLSLPSIEGTSAAFKSPEMSVELALKHGAQAVKARITSPVSGSVQAQQVNLPQLKADISASGPDLPGRTVNGELAGSASVDVGKKQAHARLAGKVADSTIKARVSVADFAQPTIGFDLDIDQLDLDRYLPSRASGGGGKAADGQKGGAPFDLTALRDLRATGTVRIGSLKAQNVKASNVRLDIKAGGGRVDVSPLAANLYQGSTAGAVSVDAAPATPAFAIRQTLSGVSVGPLLRDLADNDTLEGRGNIALDVTAQGNTVAALKRALNGTASIKLVDGAVKGIDIAGAIRNATARLGALRGEHTQASDKSQRTDFSELTATFRIHNGVASNRDLSLKSPLLRIGGEGVIDLGHDTINYLVKTSVVGTTKGQGGRDIAQLRGLTVPVRVSGPLAAPSYRLDLGALGTEAARQQIEKAVTERLLGGAAKKESGRGAPEKDAVKGGSSLRDSIKGIFGR